MFRLAHGGKRSGGCTGPSHIAVNIWQRYALGFGQLLQHGELLLVFLQRKQFLPRERGGDQSMAAAYFILQQHQKRQAATLPKPFGLIPLLGRSGRCGL